MTPRCDKCELDVDDCVCHAKSPGGGKKSDTNKLPVGLMPWPFEVVKCLVHQGQLRGDVDPIVVDMVSRGQFIRAFQQLVLLNVFTLKGALQASIIGRDRYGAYNWKGLDPSIYYHSAMRHAMHIGEPDEGCTHWDHLGWCLALLIYFDWQPVEKPNAKEND